MSEELAAQLQSIFPDEADQLPIYLGDTHGAVLEALRKDLGAGRRFICLVGPAGSGKTKLLQALRAEFEQRLVGMVTAPRDEAFLFSLMKGLGLQVPDRNQAAARQRLAVVLGMAERKHTPVLQIVDAAERLGPDELGTLFQLFGPSFTQIVLSGRPELLDLLADGRRPLGIPRPDAVHRLDGLGATETGAYISHRLRQAQLPEDLFASDASAAMHARSGGVPRRINAISREALRQAEATGGDRVGQAELEVTAKAESPQNQQTRNSGMPAASQTKPAEIPSRTAEPPSVLSDAPATPPAQRTVPSGQEQRGSSGSAESGPARSSEPAPEAQRHARASQQGPKVPPLVAPREPAAMPSPRTSKSGVSHERPVTDGTEPRPETAASPPRKSSTPTRVAPPSDVREQARDAEPPSQHNARGPDRNSERPAASDVPSSGASAASPSDIPKPPPESAMPAPRPAPTQQPSPDAQAQPQTPRAPEQAARPVSTQAPVKAPPKAPTPPPQAAETSPPRKMPRASGSNPASSGRGAQRPPRESAQLTRRQTSTDAEARPIPAAVAPRPDAGRNYLRPTLIAVAIMVAVALGISGYRGADAPSPTVAERSAGPAAGDGAAQVNGPVRPVEPPTASAAGAGDPDPSGADAPSSAITTAPTERVPGETPADAAVDFARLSSNEGPAPKPGSSASDAKDAPAETGDRSQTREPGSAAARETAEPSRAVAEVRPPASMPSAAVAQAVDQGDSGSGSASAAPAVASLSKPDPAPKAAVATRPKAASAAKRPARSAVETPSTPTPVELARLYAARADYELNRGKPREALISVAHGLAAVPEDRTLRQLRTRALEQLRVRAAH